MLRRTAAERRPDFTTLGALAVLEAEGGEVAQAERLFTEARRRYRGVSPFPVASLDFRRGLMWLGQRDLHAARAWFDVAVQRVPAYAPALGHLAEVDAALGARDAAINRLRPLAAIQRRPRVRGQPRERPQRCRAARGGRAMAHERGGPLRRTGRAPSRGLRRSRGRILAHRGWRSAKGAPAGSWNHISRATRAPATLHRVFSSD